MSPLTVYQASSFHISRVWVDDRTNTRVILVPVQIKLRLELSTETSLFKCQTVLVCYSDIQTSKSSDSKENTCKYNPVSVTVSEHEVL